MMDRRKEFIEVWVINEGYDAIEHWAEESGYTELRDYYYDSFGLRYNSIWLNSDGVPTDLYQEIENVIVEMEFE